MFIQSRFSMSIATSALQLQGIRFRIQHYSDALYDEHLIHLPAVLQDAVTKRKAEFLAGRLAARAACLGCSHAGYCHQIGIGPLRAPLWPKGVNGSITHCCISPQEGIALAVSAESIELIGIDLENELTPDIAEEVAATFATEAEISLIRKTGRVYFYLTALFSAKESFFKALSPVIGEYFDFDAIELTAITPGKLHFQVHHPRCCHQLAKSEVVIACFEFEIGLILTVAKIC